MATPEELHEAVVRIGRSNPQEHQGASKYLKLLDYSVLQKCIHCGMCLPTCPTYDETKLERNSPRGRIALMRRIADGQLEVTQALRAAGRLVWLYQASGLELLMRRLKLTAFLPPRLRALEPLSPRVQRHFSDALVLVLPVEMPANQKYRVGRSPAACRTWPFPM